MSLVVLARLLIPRFAIPTSDSGLRLPPQKARFAPVPVEHARPDPSILQPIDHSLLHPDWEVSLCGKGHVFLLIKCPHRGLRQSPLLLRPRFHRCGLLDKVSERSPFIGRSRANCWWGCLLQGEGDVICAGGTILALVVLLASGLKNLPSSSSFRPHDSDERGTPVSSWDS